MGLSNVIIDSAAVLNVSGIKDTGRYYSLTDYVREMQGKYVNVNTQGEKNFNNGRIGYYWRDGSPSQPSQVITLLTMYGSVVLGDFRLSILGVPGEILPNMQILRDIVITRKCTLYVTDSIDGFQYYHPELYLGKMVDNYKVAG